jgi:hypothetical protein
VIVRLPVSTEVLYLLIEQIDRLVQEHNTAEPEAFMPKVAAEEYYRGAMDWSLALEWRTRQGVASFNLHANRTRLCMSYIFLREAVTPEMWGKTLQHRDRPHWNKIVDYIASLGHLGVWNHEIKRLEREIARRKNTAPN